MHKSVWAILAVQFIGTLGISLVIPFLVVLVTDFGGNAIMYGVIGAMYPLFQLIGAPLLGEWSDQIGRRPVLLVSQLGTLLAWFIFLLAVFLPIQELFRIESALMGSFVVTLPLVVLAVARVLDGLTGGNLSVAQAYLADVTTDATRTKMYGRLSMASSLGFIVGPALAGLLGGTSWGVLPPILAAIVISSIASCMIWWWLPESVKKQRSKASAAAASKSAALGWRKTLMLPRVGYLSGVYLLLMMGFNLFYSGFPVHAFGALGWNVGQLGMYFAALSLMLLVVQGPVLQLMHELLSDVWLIMLGGSLLAMNFVILYLPGQGWPWLAAVFFALGNGIMWPSMLSIVSKVAGQKYQGAVQGVTTGAGSIAAILGLLAGGFLYEHVQSGVFLVSAGLILLVVCLSWPMRRWRA